MISDYTGIPWRDSLAKAEAAAKKALELDSTLAQPHAVLASPRELAWDWAGAEREYRKALELDPGYATAHQWYAQHLAEIGRLEEALAEAKRAQELDPLSLIINNVVADALYTSRRYDDSIEQSRKTLALDPNFGVAHLTLGLTYVQKSMFQEALAELQTAAKLQPGQPSVMAALGYADAVTGRRAEALKILDNLTARTGRGFTPYAEIATVYIGLGDKDRAIEWLRKAVEQRSGSRMGLKSDPLFDPLRSDPRFTDLLRRVNLPP